MPSTTAELDATPIFISSGDELQLHPHVKHIALRQFVRNRVALGSLIFLVVLGLSALAAEIIAPYDPNKLSIMTRMLSPSREHLMGTDQFGRDMFSRLLFGGRLTIFYAFIAVGIGGGAGVLLGAVAGSARGWIDAVIMRLMDILLAVPGLLLALVVLTILGPGLVNAHIAVGISMIPVYVRLVRGAILAEREREYVTAAQVVGAAPGRVMRKHILPSVWSQIVILSTSVLGWAIVIAATLNFLGLGVTPPTPEWGADLASGRDWISTGWWISTFPGLAITLSILAINFLGDGLSEALDPSMRRR